MENQMITLQFKTTTSSRTYSDWKTTNNQYHRLNGKPAQQTWYANGQKSCEVYFENNRLHRLNGKPARQLWYENGQKYCEEYYEHGEFIK